jgi:hypothetical protein
VQTARLFTEDRVALWTSSLWFGCSPFILFELTEGRPTQAIVGVLCLFLRSLWRSTQRDGIGSAVAAGLLLAVAGYQYWFYAFFGGMAALAHGLMRTARPPPAPPGWGSSRGMDITKDTALGPEPHRNPTSSVQSLGTLEVSPLFD